ncbi:MAG: hypothetical protein EP330_19980 [Deltaproteobacteria bacterium]|nr:MAG: hypothetical protein EP330_19980 [Deltaproteobacteria bacterium]
MPGWLRGSLFFTTALNLVGALTMSPLWPAAWNPPGTPVAPALHGWIISSFVLGFGIAYGWMAWTNTPNRGILALACYGKLTFAMAMYGQSAVGNMPWMVGITGTPDLVLGLMFGYYLATTK